MNIPSTLDSEQDAIAVNILIRGLEEVKRMLEVEQTIQGLFFVVVFRGFVAENDAFWG